MRRHLFLNRVLGLCLGREMADPVIGDLEEERRRRASRSRLLAELWFWSSSMRIATYAAGRPSGTAITQRAKRGVMDKLTSDLRQTLRAAARRPAATVALVLVLSLGVGLTSAMFALADPFLLRPLPYQNPDQLVEIRLSSDSTKLLRAESVLPTYEQWRQRRDLFLDLAAWSHFDSDTFSAGQIAEELSTVRVSANFFDVLGHGIEHTRGWGEFARTREAVLAMTDRGQRKTRAQHGQTLTDSGGSPKRTAAVLPGTFLFPHSRWSPLLDGVVSYEHGPVIEVTRWNQSGRPAGFESIFFIGRLAHGVTPGQAAAALSWTEASGQTIQVLVEPLRDVMTRRIRPLAQGALAAGALILLVCIGNVANLLIARNAHRSRELATRAALGASRLELTRLAAVESFVVAGTGTVIGVLV